MNVSIELYNCKFVYIKLAYKYNIHIEYYASCTFQIYLNFKLYLLLLKDKIVDLQLTV